MSKWPIVKLNEIASIYAGQGAPQGDDNYSKEGLPFIRAGHLVDLIGGVSESSFPKINENVAGKYKLKTYPKGTVLFAKSGMSCMKGYVYALKEDCYVVSHLACIYPTKVDAGYLRRYFEINRPNSLIKDEAYPSISLADISNMQIPLPPLEEQKRIAAMLDKAQSLIDLRQKQIAEMDALVKAKFIEMFGDPVRNEKGWKLATLRNVSCRISDGPFGSNLKSSHYSEKGIRVVRLQNIGVSEFLGTDKAFIPLVHYEKLKKYTCMPGDVIIGTLGEPNLRACILPECVGLAINKADCVHFVPDARKVNSRFVCEYMNQPSTLALAGGSIHGQTRSRISMSQVAALPIYVPPITLQDDFANYVRQVDILKLKKRKALNQMQSLYNALMQQAFS